MSSTASKPKTPVKISVSAPGKIILFGEHSVVYGKLAVAASLGLRTRLTLVEEESSSSEKYLRISLNALDFNVSWTLSEIERYFCLIRAPCENWLDPDSIDHDNLLKILDIFLKQTHHTIKTVEKLALQPLLYLYTAIFASARIPIKPFNITIDTELAINAGTGSSASYSVTIAAAFLQYVKMAQSKTDLINFSREELDLVSKWAFSAEKIIHGLPSGIDNTVCTYGSVVEFRKGSAPKLLESSYKLKILLIDSNVTRDTKALVAKVASLKAKHPIIVDLILNTMEEIARDALKCLALLETDASGDVKATSCYHKLEDLTDINQNMLRALGVSHASLDRIIAVLAEAGLHGKLTGAGGGGFAIAIVPASFPAAKIDETTAKLKAEGFETCFTEVGGLGVQID